MAHPIAYPPQQPTLAGKRGTSKAIPVVVAAGLAAGVFAGLMLGIGPKQNDAQPIASTQLGSGSSEEVAIPAPGNTASAIPVAVVTPDAPVDATGSAAAVAAAVPVATGSDAGSGSSAPSTPPEPVKKLAKITFAIKPPGATAEIRIDGQVVDGGVAEFDVTDGKKHVEVTASAEGFDAFKKSFDVTRDDTLAIALVKKRSSTSSTSAGKTGGGKTGGGKTGGGKTGGGKTGGGKTGGLIDI
ncbi:MAG: hypothetical protein KBG15_21155 [Kofleriaceae bacterium]|nr:hypothetical protein [Kofleriaceae bacterium]